MKTIIVVLLVLAVALAAPVTIGNIVHKEKPEDISDGQEVFLPTTGQQEQKNIPVEAGALAVTGTALAGYAIYSYAKNKKALSSAEPIVTSQPANQPTKNTMTFTQLERNTELFEPGTHTESNTEVWKDEA